MIDNLPWPIALVLFVILVAFLIKGARVDLARMAEVEAARLAQSGEVDPAAVRVLSDLGMNR